MIRIGTMGWNYDAWVGPFYPSGTRAAAFLAMYARAFDSVEVDSTFYGIPAVKTVRGWHDRTPEGFSFALKVPREVTHERRLRGAADVFAEFLAVARALGPKLGPILIQMGPDFTHAELPSLREFLPLLPGDLDFAIEFRHPSWIEDEVLALLTSHRVALTLTEARWISRRVMFELYDQPTADFRYIRFIGPDQSLTDFSRVQVDRSKEVAEWAALSVDDRKALSRDHFYINNHFTGHSPATARLLQERLGLPTVAPERLGEQLTLL